MQMYPKGSKDSVEVSQKQIDVLKKAGWTTELGKDVEEKPEEKPVVPKVEPKKVETPTATASKTTAK